MMAWGAQADLDRLASAWTAVLAFTIALRILSVPRGSGIAAADTGRRKGAPGGKQTGRAVPVRFTNGLLLAMMVLTATAAWNSADSGAGYLRASAVVGLLIAWFIPPTAPRNPAGLARALALAGGVCALAAHVWSSNVLASPEQPWVAQIHFLAAALLAATALQSALLLTGAARPDTAHASPAARGTWRWLARLALVAAGIEFAYAGALLLGGPLPMQLAQADGEAAALVRPVLALALALGSFVAWQVPHRVHACYLAGKSLEQPAALAWSAWIGVLIFGLVVSLV
ncbi:MAG: hypothetical protein D6753_01515 [Planctomycetota bacterium]|nr:MAG: hypothetical protein D6753_01515 [Planctomycetota bacterium]